MSFVKCQFKNSTNEREKNFFGNIFFYSWRNLFTQCGLNELILLIFSSPFLNFHKYFYLIFIFFVAGYLILSSAILLGIIFLSFLKHD